MSKTATGNIRKISDAKEARLFAYNKEHYGNTIRDNRKRKGLTQQQVADMTGVSKNHVTNWEAGRARPDLNIIPTLCNALEISLPAFFSVPSSKDALTQDESQVLSRYRRLTNRDQLVVKATMDKMIDLSTSDLFEYCRTSFIPIMHNYQPAAAGTATMLEEGTEQYQTYVRRSRAAEQADEIVTVNGSSMEPMFYNGQDVYVEHIRIIKQDALDRHAIEGVQFDIYLVNADGSVGDLVASMTTDQNGMAESPELFSAIYLVKEHNNPEGYVDELWSENIILGMDEDVTRTVTNKPIQGKIRIMKTDSETGKGLPGAVFTVTRISGLPSHNGDNDGEIVAVITSGQDGIAETPLLTWGEYEIVETSVPENYLDEGYTTRVRIPGDAADNP